MVALVNRGGRKREFYKRNGVHFLEKQDLVDVANNSDFSAFIGSEKYFSAVFIIWKNGNRKVGGLWSFQTIHPHGPLILLCLLDKQFLEGSGTCMHL